MPKMRAIEAAVRVLEREGVSVAFGVPGAAINPLYAALRSRGSIRHILARHVEGASHMADGYTRAAPGNIGVCIGNLRTRRHRHDHRPLHRPGRQHPYPLHHRPSPPRQAPQGGLPSRRHRDDRQTRHQMGRLRPRTRPRPANPPASLPRHAFRPPRPPSSSTFPSTSQMAEIEFDEEFYEPLPIYKPTASRKQAEHAIAMLNAAHRPLIVAGGGIINADSCALLVEFAELVNVPVIPTLMGWGAIPDDHPLMAGMVGLQTSHRYGNATFLESDFVFGIGNRWANRHTGSIEVYTRGRTFVHVDIEPTQIGRVFGPRLRHRLRRPRRPRDLHRRRPRHEGRRNPRRPPRLGRRLPPPQETTCSASPTSTPSP